MERTMMDMIDLSDKQEKAVALAVCGKRDGEIAAVIGVTRKTVNRWRNHDADFRAALAAHREAMREETMDALQGLAARATQVLAEAMESQNAYVRLKAAGLVLKLCEQGTRKRQEKAAGQATVERQIVIASLTEALTEMGRGGKN